MRIFSRCPVLGDGRRDMGLMKIGCLRRKGLLFRQDRPLRFENDFRPLWVIFFFFFLQLQANIVIEINKLNGIPYKYLLMVIILIVYFDD